MFEREERPRVDQQLQSKESGILGPDFERATKAHHPLSPRTRPNLTDAPQVTFHAENLCEVKGQYFAV